MRSVSSEFRPANFSGSFCHSAEVVKTKDKATLVQDLEETFRNLRKINLKLNPEKCVFGVPSGKLLGFFVSQRGIEANPDKIKAIEQIEAPKQIKDVHRLTGCVAAMSRFISKSAERALPEVCLWCPIRQASRVLCVAARDRGKPRQNQGY